MIVLDTPPNGVDDSDTFKRAIDAALTEGPTYDNARLGVEQCQFSVPAGRWRLRDVDWPDYMRGIVDAGAFLQLPGGAGWDSTHATWLRVPMFTWGSVGNNPSLVRGVSLVAAGQNMSSPKSRFQKTDPLLLSAPVDKMFSFVVDPNTSRATNNAVAIDFANVDGYELTDAFFIENNTNQAVPAGQGDAYPTTSVAPLSIRAAKNSPLNVDPSLFLQPKNGFIDRIACAQGPRGYGPMQINACDNLEFGTIWHVGGTGLRVETDGSLVNLNTGGMDRGACVRGLYCEEVIGAYCNRGASITPHGQHNFDVEIGSIRTAYAFQSLVASKSNKQGGYFTSAKVRAIDATGGQGAQVKSYNGMTWDVGLSECVTSIDGGLEWLAACDFPVPTHRGTFTKSKLY